MDIAKIALQNPGLARVLCWASHRGHYMVSGTSGSQRALLVDLWRTSTKESVLFITSDLNDAEELLLDYEFFSGKKGLLFPGKPTLGEEVDAESHELEHQRAHALGQVLTRPSVMAAPVTALLELLPPPQHLATEAIDLAAGTEITLADLSRRLLSLGYQSVERVEAPAQFSQRGEIVDVYPPGASPCRLEFFDVVLESIRTFDIETQRSNETLDSLHLGPARVLVLSPQLRERALDKLQARAKRISPLFLPQLEQDRERFSQLHYWPGCQHYMQYLFAKRHSLLDYFSQGWVMMAESVDLIKQLQLLSQELMERHQALLEKGKLLPDLQPWFSADQVVDNLHQASTLHTSLLTRSLKQFSLTGLANLSFRQVPNFYGQQQLVSDEVKAWLKQGATVVIVGGGQQLAQSLKARDIAVRHSDPSDLTPNIVNFVPGALSSGFELVEQGLVVLSFKELAARRKKPSKPKHKHGLSASDLKSLQAGEYVVHASYGIGQFLGIVTREIAGTKSDYLYIKYAGKDRLYLPTDQVHLLQRYLGGGESPPKLYSLGGGEWQKVRKRVEQSVQKLAFDLLELYARRQAQRGYAFAPDTPWQRELEDSFPFQETEDQLKAIEEVKKDMESPRPMDRLLCGDVGYGKTEVALRATMKAVMDGKQVAILAPTTVLAQQHYQSFQERLAPFPIRVEVLSRFKSKGQQREIIKQVVAGTVDVVIGTHRLLQEDVRLPGLGLLVVDEEQRFGVGDKEKIKQLKADVDILTMTATPIPRTLHMALLGIRDLSVINTPPEGRYPVQTYVMEYTNELAVSAVRRELDRGGQVYMVYNRVQGIDKLAGQLRRLMPGVDIGVIHGRMAEGTLERTMLAFYQGKYQVLLSTTIIENGLDIPNVNTVLVYHADRLGLSQLYQLRGRVGRGRRLAYAYFTYDKDKVLTEKSQKRLNAIKEFTELGAGYKLSLRDLEIRGTGNILGPEQHGYIAAVGFDLYCQLLEQQVKALTGEETQHKPVPEVKIELPISAYVPDGYMPEQEKIYIYRAIGKAFSLQALEDVQDELFDRFGALPTSVENLLDIGRIRVLAAEAGVSSITWRRDQLTGTERALLQFQSGEAPPSTFLQKLWVRDTDKYDFDVKTDTQVHLKTTPGAVLPELEKLLHLISAHDN